MPTPLRMRCILVFALCSQMTNEASIFFSFSRLLGLLGKAGINLSGFQLEFEPDQLGLKANCDSVTVWQTNSHLSEHPKTHRKDHFGSTQIYFCQVTGKRFSLI